MNTECKVRLCEGGIFECAREELLRRAETAEKRVALLEATLIKTPEELHRLSAVVGEWRYGKRI